MLKFLLCLCFFLCPDVQPPQVMTNLGYLEGKWMHSRNGNRYLAFLGVPYAKPPIGQLRFRDPEEAGRWEGVRDATSAREKCVQWNYLFRGDQNTTGSEDCLYLNIYTPDTKYGALLPVIVYFHGGGFEFGESVENHGPGYWMDERVVVVTVAYRLGALGFLSFEDPDLPGNMGLKDQVLALRWVRQNIPAFGGHPKRLTLMGESAGAASVNLHLISPRSKGLFQGGISMSGSAYSPWAWVRPGVARERALRTAEAAGCRANSTRLMVDCLRGLPARNITDLRRAFINEKRDPLVFYGPVVDNAATKPFLPKAPDQLSHANVPWLTGIVSAEGVLKTGTYTVIPSFDWQELDLNFTSYINSALWFQYPQGETRNADDLRKFYLGDRPLDESSYLNITNLFGDSMFFYPTIEGIRRHPGPVYLYYFDYVGENSYAKFIGSRKVVNGSCHTDEGIYLWEVGYFPPLKGDDLSFSRSLIKMWTNFAKYGCPTTKDSIINWERYDKDNRHLYMHNGGFTVQSDLLLERNRFWSSRQTE